MNQSISGRSRRRDCPCRSSIDLVSHIYKLNPGSSDITGVCGVAIKTSDVVVDWVFWAAIPGPADPVQGFLDDDVFAGVKTLALAIAIFATLIDCCRACLHGILPRNKSKWGVNNSTLYKARAYVYSGIADSVIDDGLSIAASIWFVELADSNVDWTLLGLNIATSVLGLLHVLYLVTLLVLSEPVGQSGPGYLEPQK